jgi:polar amino acid transport system substrate-binding protein
MPAGSTMHAIQERGKLFVGVDESTPYFSYRNPESGPFSDPDRPAGEFVGFEPELARRVGDAIFGEGGADNVEFVPLVTGRKVDAVVDGVANGGVDMTISVVSAECDRWDKVDFTTTYYVTTQGILVRTDSAIEDRDDLAGRRVCVTRGSSSQDYLADSQPEAQVVPVATRPECLVALQEHDVDAVVLPKSILAGLAAQDPTLAIRPDRLQDQYYGISIAKNPGKGQDLVRFVNGLLEQWRTDDTLAALQHKWLDPVPATGVPTARYSDR